MKDSRIAILLTCHNDGATLRETIASIRREPAGVELILVDDGSTDPATAHLVAELEREGVFVIRQANEGQAAAAMSALEASTAPYVMRFDADDLLEPGAVVALADALDAAPGAAAAWGDVQTFGSTSFRIPGAPALDPWLVTYTNCTTGSGSLFRRTALVEAGGWKLPTGFDDWDLWMSLAELGYGGVHVPRVVFHYRRDGDGRMADTGANADKHYETLRRGHEQLFATRGENRRRSSAPRALKFAVPIIEAIPAIRRLTKIQLCELLGRLLWGDGVRPTAMMAHQAARLRLLRLWSRRQGAA